MVPMDYYCRIIDRAYRLFVLKTIFDARCVLTFASLVQIGFVRDKQRINVAISR